MAHRSLVLGSRPPSAVPGPFWPSMLRPSASQEKAARPQGLEARRFSPRFGGRLQLWMPEGPEIRREADAIDAALAGRRADPCRIPRAGPRGTRPRVAWRNRRPSLRTGQGDADRVQQRIHALQPQSALRPLVGDAGHPRSGARAAHRARHPGQRSFTCGAVQRHPDRARAHHRGRPASLPGQARSRHARRRPRPRTSSRRASRIRAARAAVSAPCSSTRRSSPGSATTCAATSCSPPVWPTTGGPAPSRAAERRRLARAIRDVARRSYATQGITNTPAHVRRLSAAGVKRGALRFRAYGRAGQSMLGLRHAHPPGRGQRPGTFLLRAMSTGLTAPHATRRIRETTCRNVPHRGALPLPGRARHAPSRPLRARCERPRAALASPAVGGRLRAAVDARRQPRQVAPRAHHLVLRDVRSRPRHAGVRSRSMRRSASCSTRTTTASARASPASRARAHLTAGPGACARVPRVRRCGDGRALAASARSRARRAGGARAPARAAASGAHPDRREAPARRQSAQARLSAALAPQGRQAPGARVAALRRRSRISSVTTATASPSTTRVRGIARSWHPSSSRRVR